MALIDILNPEIIDLKMEVQTKDEALRHLSDLLLDAGYITDETSFISDIYLREQEGITGIGSGIAIPHGKSDSVTKIGIAIGRTVTSIPWESLDDEPVNLIFLFCVSNDMEYARNHMILLAEIAGKLGNDRRVEQLQAALTKTELIKLLAE